MEHDNGPDALTLAMACTPTGAAVAKTGHPRDLEHMRRSLAMCVDVAQGLGKS